MPPQPFLAATDGRLPVEAVRPLVGGMRIGTDGRRFSSMLVVSEAIA